MTRGLCVDHIVGNGTVIFEPFILSISHAVRWILRGISKNNFDVFRVWNVYFTRAIFHNYSYDERDIFMCECDRDLA